MKTITFDNLIDSKTGETIELEVDDDFDTAPMKEWYRKARESGKRISNSLQKELIAKGHAILDDVEDIMSQWPKKNEANNR